MREFIGNVETAGRNKVIIGPLPLPVIIANGTAITVYHVLFIAAQIFQLVLITDALMGLSLIQLVTTTIFNFAIWGYTLVQFGQAANFLPLKVQNGLGITNGHPTFVPEVIQIILVSRTLEESMIWYSTRIRYFQRSF